MAIGRFGSVRFGKLGLPDTDFEDTIQKLKSVEARYGKQLLRWKEDWNLRLKGFEEVRKELGELRSALAPLSNVDSFLVKGTSSTDKAIATASSNSQSMDGSYNLEVGQLATQSSWTLNTGLPNRNAVINTSGEQGSFVYSYKGQVRTVPIAPGMTIEGLRNLINNNTAHQGVRVSLSQGTSGVVFQMHTTDTGDAAHLEILSSSNLSALPVNIDYTDKWKGNANKLELMRTYADPNAPLLGAGDADQTFIFSFNGTRSTITIDSQTSLQSFIDKVNKAVPEKEAPIAFIDAVDGGYRLRFQKDNEILPSQVNDELAELQKKTDFATPDVEIAGPKHYSVTTDGKTYTASFEGNHTPAQVVQSLNLQKQGIATLKPELVDGKYQFSVKINDLEKKNSIEISSQGTFADFRYSTPTDSAWQVQEGQNSKIRVNGWPKAPDNWFESSSNKISDAIEGMTFNLNGTGKTQISTTVDTSSMYKNVQTFVDSVNKLRKLFAKLTEVDSEKPVLDASTAESMFELQQGSILTGNYGIQLIDSRIKHAIASVGVGFVHSKVVDDILTGDRYTSLAQLGILTNAEKGSPNYGLLEIKLANDGKTGKSFTELLAEDPMAVAELFAARDQGKSYSPGIGYNSHIQRITKPGLYGVEYDVDSSGNVDPSSVKINGKAGVYYPSTNQIGLITAPGERRDPADGLVVDIYDLSPGKHSGEIGIKEGKINEIIGMLDGPEGILNRERGTLGILEKNYKDIITNIDKKIYAEDRRIRNWEYHMVMKFSRLESSLTSYNRLNDQFKNLANQLGQK